MSRYDAVVVGSGLGGLAAAATLTREGFGVRLLERHNQPGGYATSFTRGRFEFEVSLHAMTGVRQPDKREPPLTPLEELGVADLVEFVQLPDLHRSIAPGLDLRVPVGRQAALDAFSAAFPREHRGFERIFKEIFAIKGELEQLSSNGGPQPSALAAIRDLPRIAHASAVPLSHLVYRELKDPLARLAMAQLWTYFGMPPERLSLLFFAIAYTTMVERGISYPLGKSQTLSNAFVQVIEQAGGEVSLGNGATEIEVRDGQVTAVITEAGERLETDIVISNANPFTTSFDLIGSENIAPGYLRGLSTMQPSISAVGVYLGLDRTAEALGLEDYEVFFNDTVSLDAQYEQASHLAPPASFLLTAYGAEVPGFSPPGTTVVTMTAPAQGRVWREAPPARYHETKQRIAEAMMTRASRLYPDLRDHIEVAVVSTPLTNMRFTGNPDGAIYGLAMTPAQCPAFRLPQEGPVRGLWLAGAWTQPGGGYEPAIESGMQAANAVIAELRSQRVESRAAV